MSSPASTPKSNDPIDALQQRVAGLHQQMSRSTATTAVIGIVAVVLLTIYFNYAYNQIVDLTKPQSIVMHVDQVLIDNLTPTRQALQKQIQDSAPEWATQLSRQAIESVPELRKGVESFVLEHVEEQMDEVELIGATEFKQLLDEHKDEFRAHARLLAKDGKLPEESMNDFVAMYDRHFQLSFKESTETLFEGLFNMNKNLLRLKANQDLTEEERQQRRLIMLAKAVQAQRHTLKPVSDKPASDKEASDKQAMNRPTQPGQ